MFILDLRAARVLCNARITSDEIKFQTLQSYLNIPYNLLIDASCLIRLRKSDGMIGIENAWAAIKISDGILV